MEDRKQVKNQNTSEPPDVVKCDETRFWSFRCHAMPHLPRAAQRAQYVQVQPATRRVHDRDNLVEALPFGGLAQVLAQRGVDRQLRAPSEELGVVYAVALSIGARS